MSRITVDAAASLSSVADKAIQDADFVENNKYTQKLAETIADGTVSTTEYVAPNGFGWEKIFTVTEGKDTYRKVEGEGVEAFWRNHDWQLVVEDDD